MRIGDIEIEVRRGDLSRFGTLLGAPSELVVRLWRGTHVESEITQNITRKEAAALMAEIGLAE